MEKAIQILIVEDDMISAATLSVHLTNWGYEVIGILTNAEEALNFIKKHQPDILLLDINLKEGIDGIEMAHEMQKLFSIPIIYLTADSENTHFERAKATNPYAFIIKPFEKIDLLHAIELVINHIKCNLVAESSTISSQGSSFILSDCIFVRHHEKMVKICIKNILYVEAERNYCRIHCKDKEYLLVITLKDLAKKLPSKHFIRIHRSFIVNLSHIDELAISHLVIAKKAIPISKTSKEELYSRLRTI
jgi:DNA-binding LytR/AlgR family response regulator